jgi:hypothetical protein
MLSDCDNKIIFCRHIHGIGKVDVWPTRRESEAGRQSSDHAGNRQR